MRLLSAAILTIALPAYASAPQTAPPGDMSYDEWQKYQDNHKDFEAYQEASQKAKMDASIAELEALGAKKKAEEPKVVTVGSSSSASTLKSAFSYHYIELGVESAIIDMGDGYDDLTGTGFGAGASFAVSDHVAITADVAILIYDEWHGVEADGTASSIGLIVHAPMSPRADIMAGFSLNRVNLDFTNTYNGATDSESDTSKNLGIGMRFMPNEAIELMAGFSKDPTDSDDDLSTTIGLRTSTKNQASFGVNISSSKDVFGVGVSLRINI